MKFVLSVFAFLFIQFNLFAHPACESWIESGESSFSWGKTVYVWNMDESITFYKETGLEADDVALRITTYTGLNCSLTSLEKVSNDCLKVVVNWETGTPVGSCFLKLYRKSDNRFLVGTSELFIDYPL